MSSHSISGRSNLEFRDYSTIVHFSPYEFIIPFMVQKIHHLPAMQLITFYRLYLLPLIHITPHDVQCPFHLGLFVLQIENWLSPLSAKMHFCCTHSLLCKSVSQRVHTLVEGIRAAAHRRVLLTQAVAIPFSLTAKGNQDNPKK